jgi:hypothetical protein
MGLCWKCVKLNATSFTIVSNVDENAVQKAEKRRSSSKLRRSMSMGCATNSNFQGPFDFASLVCVTSALVLCNCV